jgi:hypothetical protein
MYPAKIICHHFICCVYNRNKIFYCFTVLLPISFASPFPPLYTPLPLRSPPLVYLPLFLFLAPPFLFYLSLIHLPIFFASPFPPLYVLPLPFMTPLSCSSPSPLPSHHPSSHLPLFPSPPLSLCLSSPLPLSFLPLFPSSPLTLSLSPSLSPSYNEVILWRKEYSIPAAPVIICGCTAGKNAGKFRHIQRDITSDYMYSCVTFFSRKLFGHFRKQKMKSYCKNYLNSAWGGRHSVCLI